MAGGKSSTSQSYIQVQVHKLKKVWHRKRFKEGSKCLADNQLDDGSCHRGGGWCVPKNAIARPDSKSFCLTFFLDNCYKHIIPKQFYISAFTVWRGSQALACYSDIIHSSEKWPISAIILIIPEVHMTIILSLIIICRFSSFNLEMIISSQIAHYGPNPSAWFETFVVP